MKTGITIEYIKQQLASGKIRGYKINNVEPIVMPVEQKKEKKKSKYGNRKNEVDGIVFDSEKEAMRYGQLKLMLKAGIIGLLDLQVPYELNPGGTHSLKYIADFVYIIRATGEKVVEDAKGCRTREYIKKRRLMKKVHGIIIKEV
jgi:hypothetical protein